MNKPLSFGATMLASALGIIIVSAVGGLLMLVMTIGMIAALGSKADDDTPKVRRGTCLRLDLGTLQGDRTQSELMQAFGDSRTVGLIDAVRSINRAATDDRISGLLITDGDGITASWASMQELREAVARFRASGKPVVSYATAYSQQGYYLASAAEHVLLHPSGMVDLRGLGGEVLYYKDMLDKLGIEMQLIRPESCTYKSAGEVYTMNHMSTANREQIRSYRSAIWQQVAAAMAESRSLTVAEFNSLATHLSAYLATDALRTGIVDSLCFEEDAKAMLRDRSEGSRLMSVANYAATLAPDKASTADHIAIVCAEGNVMDGSGNGWDEGIYADDIVKSLRQAADDESVKAIVLRINSPGGLATASESMTYAVVQAREKKPLVVSMGDVAASAGYEMACMADCIVAQPTTVTGSIGVFGTIPNLQKLMQQKLGLTADTVATHPNANSLSLLRPLSPAAHQLLTRNVEEFYKVFVGRVAEGRHMTFDEVHRIARGRVWAGIEAQRIGLVDTLGGLDLALSIAASKAGISDYRLAFYPLEKDIWSQLLSLFGQDESDDISLHTKMRLAWKWHTLGKHRPTLNRLERDLRYLATSDGLQARLPFIITGD